MVTDTFFSREPVTVASDFVGRKEAIEWVAAKLGARHPQNINIVGEPKIGKSSLLRYIVNQRVGAVPLVKMVYVWLDLLTLPVCDSEQFWPFLLRQLQTAVSQANISLPELDGDLPPQNQIADLLDTLQQKERPLRLILVIDAFERLSPELSEKDLDWLRSLTTAHSDWLAFVIGSPKPLNQLLAQWEQSMIGSLFSEQFKDYYLVLLSDDESIAFCRQASEAFAGGSLSRQDLDFLLAEAGPHPALLKMACEYLLQAQAGASRHPYEDAAADLRLDSGVQSLCNRLWLARSPEEQAMLFALAQGQETGNRQLLVRKLGLAVERNGRLQLFSRVFADFVRQQAT
ncbi:MAG: ATP-binding protein, partial [Candidatus Thermofonsia bacterium]